MTIGIYARPLKADAMQSLLELLAELSRNQVEMLLYKPLYESIANLQPYQHCRPFEDAATLCKEADCLITVGGDGTLLDAVSLISGCNLPVLGLNFGRLGFLASVNKQGIRQAIEQLVHGNYSLDKRSMVELHADRDLFQGVHQALNEFAIHKRDSSSMITIHAYLNGDYLNTYWADGLIVATPTGSTGYSMSCGGPIILPSNKNFIVTPVAPHNLNVRPVIVPDDVVISFEIEHRESNFLISLDSRTEVIDSTVQLAIRKADRCFNLIRLQHENYLTTLRNKLMWGIDRRNY